ncbi:MAG: plasmid pRiA4b ORF-3 family protein [Cyanobacteria bacterium J06627_28]
MGNGKPTETKLTEKKPTETKLTEMPPAYQLKVALVDSEPEVWRRIVVPADITLETLHGLLQRAMGWENLHDYSFRIGLSPNQVLCDRTMLLSQYITHHIDSYKQQPLYYYYDPDCGWAHRLTLEALDISEHEETTLPTCLDGAAACPPENIGGIWGYEEMLTTLEDPEDPTYLDLLDKYGDFDPLAFSLTEANQRLA